MHQDQHCCLLPSEHLVAFSGGAGGVMGVRNCLLSRQQCADDPACRSILDIIPRVCGPESVACSTVTVNKCLAALRTLQGFPYFQPTCLCREPHLDRECNTFHEFIFDHPCSFVEKNAGATPYTVHALPTCEYALRACETLPGCIPLYNNFHQACVVQDGVCRMASSDHCLAAWSNLKVSPMFGCICPNDHEKKKCLKIFDMVHQNPCVGLTSSRREPMITSLQKTCQTTLIDCMNDRQCKRLLDPVLATCDATQCNQEACMDNLQKFYRNAETRWAMDVAFCLCKRSSLTSDDCLAAQELLHPTCARKSASAAPLLCHRLAKTCKEDVSCRHRLEFYEQACAVDSDTQRCAGSSSECRRSVTGILGTELRVLCSCASTDTRETYVCMDWQRILWFNPCVVESQTDYHREMLIAMSPGVELTTSANIVYSPRITTEVLSEQVHHGVGGSQQAHQGGARVAPPGAVTPSPGSGQNWHPKTQLATTTTTRRPTTTTIPPNYCENHYSSREDRQDHIVEGGGKRYYTVSDPSCSELCLCHAGKELVCNVLQCVEARPCETNVAIYIHAAPAFMAYRGECLCYSGSFICVRPHQTKYDAGEGLYLFIGFSQAEEELLNPYTQLSVIDTIPRLQILLEEAAVSVNESYCLLSLQQKLSQNLILQVTLPELDEHRENMSAIMFNREKDECVDSLQIVADKINSQDEEDIRSDVALSMMMLAEVHINIPPMPAGALSIQQHSTSTLSLALSLLTSLLALSIDRGLPVRFCCSS